MTRPEGRAAAGHPDRRGDDRCRAARVAASAAVAGARHRRWGRGRGADAYSVAGVTSHEHQPAGAYSRGGVRTLAADRRGWAADVAAQPGRRRRGDQAADGCAGGAEARREAAARRRRRLDSVGQPGAAAGVDPAAPAGSHPGAAAGSHPAAPAGSHPGAAVGLDPGAPVGSDPGAAVRPMHVAGAPAHAALRARTVRRVTSRSTGSGAGPRAARPAVRAASPGPDAAHRAGARSTSGQTSPSAQVVAPCSA
jgi:hypothetical protein